MASAFLPVDLSGLRVVVTAGAAGIGRVVAEAFAARGARVHVCDVAPEALDRVARELPALSTSRTDVADPLAVAAMFGQVAREFGGLDVLVNNAGVAGPTARVEDVAPDALAHTLAVNVASQFHCARLAVPMLKAAGGGAIVNMSSAAGRLGYAMRSPYAAAKWGVIGFTRSLAIELGGDDIRVNAILPGHVESERFGRVVEAKAAALGIATDAMRRRILDVVSLKRTVEPAEVANMILYLCSPFGTAITGQAISVCGDVQMMQ
jgi:NAD(P)-dependent dehydrogenase (short-subunit alcohol dehydrogenase family)